MSGLQFEWAWQHPGKSLHVRNAIGDPDATALSRKRGIRAALGVLRTLISDCDVFRKYSLSLHFLEEKWRDEFLRIKHETELPGHIAHEICPVEEMPFWEDCKKVTRRPRRNKESESQVVDAEKQKTHVSKCKRCCFLCKRPVNDNECPITCNECSVHFHELCIEDHFEKGATTNFRFPVRW